jgi:hypothetical protein
VISETWEKLFTWSEESPCKRGSHQWLEQSVPVEAPGLEFALDLYLPIAE